MILRFLGLALLFGFWMPPLVFGRWMSTRPRRTGRATLVALAWTLVWFVVSLLVMLPFDLETAKAPQNIDGPPIPFVTRLILTATVVVLPVSLLACWIGAQRHWWQGTTGAKVRLGVSVAMFVVIQLLIVGLIGLMLLS